MKRLQIIPILLLSMLSSTVQSQVKPPNIQFHGSNIFTGQYATGQGSWTEIPDSYFWNELKMTLTAYDIPVSASFFYTSMDDPSRQQINNFRVYFDHRKLMQNKGLTGDIVSSAALTNLKNAEKVIANLENAEKLLNTNLLEKGNEIESLQKAQSAAEKELEDAIRDQNNDKIASARAKSEDMQEKIKSAQAAYENLKSKLAVSNEQIEANKQKLERTKERLEEIKSLDLDKGSVRRMAEKDAKNSVMHGFTRFMSNFRTLEIGRCRPYYSELTLSGIPLTGVNIEFTPGIFYSAFTSGRTLRAIDGDSLKRPVYEQNILHGKIGIGKKQGTHFYITYLRAEDDFKSLPPPPEVDTIHYLRARANDVVGAELRLALFKKKLIIDGEGAASLITNDINAKAFEVEENNLPQWAIEYFQPNFSSSADYAYNLNATLKLNTTNITGGWKWIGSQFKTLGNPNLINDRSTWQGRINQTFAKRQVNIALFVRHHNDNLIKWKKNSSTVLSYGVNAAFRFRKMPYFIFAYAPNFQETGQDFMKINNAVTMVTATAGHNYKIKNSRANTSLSVFHNQSKTVLEADTNWVQNTTCTFNNMINFGASFNLTLSASYSQMDYLSEIREVIMLNLSGTINALKGKWQNTLGGVYFSQQSQQLKLGCFLNTRIVLIKGCDLGLRMDYNTFEDRMSTVENFNQFISQLTFRLSW